MYVRRYVRLYPVQRGTAVGRLTSWTGLRHLGVFINEI